MIYFCYLCKINIHILYIKNSRVNNLNNFQVLFNFKRLMNIIQASINYKNSVLGNIIIYCNKIPINYITHLKIYF